MTATPDSETIMNDPKGIQLEDQKAVDTALADELNKMSVQERETIYEEIHGVERIIPEPPEFVNERLEMMQQELLKIEDKPVYDMAEEMSKEYVTDPKFRLMFLRSDNFNPKKAAIRMVRFFAGKLRLFGKDTLVRPLYLSDLDEGDRKALDSGIYQWLPSRDRSGRVVFLDLRSFVERTWPRGMNCIKAALYLVITALEDEETQRRGIVTLVYHMGTKSGGMDVDSEVLRESPAAIKFLPYKNICVHLCFGNPWVSPFTRALLGVCGPDFRARARLHSGSHTEVQYSLMTFGLPMDLFPVSTDGEVKKSNLEKWIVKRKKKETLLQESTSEFDRVDMPSRYDILVGKGKPFQRHVGNVRLRTMVESYVEKNEGTPLGGKSQVARWMLSLVRQDGGRFLRKENDGWWTEVSESDALDKIGKLYTSVKASSKERRRTQKSTEYKLKGSSDYTNGNSGRAFTDKRIRTGCFQHCSFAGKRQVDM